MLSRNRFFSEAVRSLTGRLTAVARRIVHDEELARDAVQEALLSLWLEANPPLNPRAWLIRTVKNRCLHMARSRSRRLRHEAKARQLRPEASHCDNPVDRLERDEMDRMFFQSLDLLAADQRTVLVLSMIDELDYQTIALALDIPIGTVRSRLSRARQSLRNVLERLLSEGGQSQRVVLSASRRSVGTNR